MHPFASECIEIKIRNHRCPYCVHFWGSGNNAHILRFAAIAAARFCLMASGTLYTHADAHSHTHAHTHTYTHIHTLTDILTHFTHDCLAPRIFVFWNNCAHIRLWCFFFLSLLLLL